MSFNPFVSIKLFMIRGNSFAEACWDGGGAYVTEGVACFSDGAIGKGSVGSWSRDVASSGDWGKGVLAGCGTCGEFDVFLFFGIRWYVVLSVSNRAMSFSLYRRSPPGVRVLEMIPAFSHRRSVLFDTPARLAAPLMLTCLGCEPDP